ncbi:RNA polymerase sigma factor SigF [Streptomyces sp. NPDC051994]|uniref:RNA polymerase sigma factor SigF n=1 Tax=unclassified Streptomyces TaxID=2593676 RepID=UPI00344341FE
MAAVAGLEQQDRAATITVESGATELPWIEDAGKVAPRDARQLSKLFFAQLQELEEGTREHQYARNTLIEMNLALVRYAASRFRNRGGGEMEDVIQVGTIGLIKAIDRFELSREVEFATFAVPYIVGEIKRFFRDTTWAVHVPRRLQELRVDIAKGKEHLALALDRDPTVKELAAHLELSEEEVIEGLVASNGYTAGSLDTSADPDGGSQSSGVRSRTLADFVGEEDPGMEKVENVQTLAPLMEQLSERERHILDMRFGLEMTQAQIGGELGVSQMQVSRLLSRILTKLRTGMLSEAV